MQEEELKILIFRVNNEYYATDIMEVERILGHEEPTKLPDSPKFIEGVINYENKILPIIRLDRRFNLTECENKDESKIIVTKQNNGKIGVVVDAVTEVRDVKSSLVESAPEIVSGVSRRYIRGLIKVDNRIIIFLELATILTDEEKVLI